MIIKSFYKLILRFWIFISFICLVLLAGIIIQNETLILYWDKRLHKVIIGSFHLNWSIYEIFFKVFIAKITHSISTEFCRPRRYLLFKICIVISKIQIIFHAFSSVKIILVIAFIDNHFRFLSEYRIILSCFPSVEIITFKHSVWPKKIYPFLRGLLNIFLNIKYRLTIFMGWLVNLILKLRVELSFILKFDLVLLIVMNLKMSIVVILIIQLILLKFRFKHLVRKFSLWV